MIYNGNRVIIIIAYQRKRKGFILNRGDKMNDKIYLYTRDFGSEGPYPIGIITKLGDEYSFEYDAGAHERWYRTIQQNLFLYDSIMGRLAWIENMTNTSKSFKFEEIRAASGMSKITILDKL